MYLASLNTPRELGLVALYSFPVMLIITFARRNGRSVWGEGHRGAGDLYGGANRGEDHGREKTLKSVLHSFLSWQPWHSAHWWFCDVCSGVCGLATKFSSNTGCHVWPNAALIDLLITSFQPSVNNLLWGRQSSSTKLVPQWSICCSGCIYYLVWICLTYRADMSEIKRKSFCVLSSKHCVTWI